MSGFKEDLNLILDGMAAGAGAEQELKTFLLSLSCLLGFMGILVLYFKLSANTRKNLKTFQDSVAGFRGKTEKLEQELHEIKTNILRSKEINAEKLDEIKAAVDLLKKKEG